MISQLLDNPEFMDNLDSYVPQSVPMLRSVSSAANDASWVYTLPVKPLASSAVSSVASSVALLKADAPVYECLHQTLVFYRRHLMYKCGCQESPSDMLRVLDIGCGGPDMDDGMGDRYPGISKYVGVDYSQACINAQCAARHTGMCDYVRANARELLICPDVMSAREFDIVCAFLSIEYILHRENSASIFFDTVSNYLAKGGYFTGITLDTGFVLRIILNTLTPTSTEGGVSRYNLGSSDSSSPLLFDADQSLPALRAWKVTPSNQGHYIFYCAYAAIRVSELDYERLVSSEEYPLFGFRIEIRFAGRKQQSASSSKDRRRHRMGKWHTTYLCEKSSLEKIAGTYHLRLIEWTSLRKHIHDTPNVSHAIADPAAWELTGFFRGFTFIKCQ